MTMTRWQRLAALSGTGFFVLALIGRLTYPKSPGFVDAPAVIAAFYERHHAAVLASNVPYLLATIFLFAFAGHLRSVLAATDEGVAATVFGAMAAGAALLLAGSAVDMVAALRVQDQHAIAAPVAATLWDLNMTLFGSAAPIAFAVATLGTAIVSLRSGALPAWHGVASVALGVALAVPPIGHVAIIVFLFWVLATSLLLARGEVTIRRKLPVVAGALGALWLLAGAPAQAAYPGDNGTVVFTSTQDGGARHIFLRTSTGITDLTGASSTATESQPEFSPDGRRIAFTRSDASNGQIFVMSAGGTHRRQLTNTPTGNSDPTWSPDGRRIAFVSARGGTPDIYVMRANGRHVRRITRDAAAESDLAWSPRGDRIAFTRAPAGGGNPDIYTVELNGSGLENLTHDPSSAELEPDFSPDGAQIVYSGPFHPSGSEGDDLWIMGADGSGARPLEHQQGFYSDGAFPAWSPDGTTIAFAANNGSGYYHVWSVPAAGGQNAELVTNSIPGSNPVDQEVDWQPLVPRAKITSARVSGRRRVATFRFRAIGAATGFRCALHRRGRRWRFSPCTSAKRYRRLRPGRYTFAVLAVGPHGSQPWPTRHAFRIARRHRRSR